MKSNFPIFFRLLLLLPFLSSCASRNGKATGEAAVGKAHFEGFGCATCHKGGGKGGTLGPDLTFVGFRKTPEWLDLWLKDPNHWKRNPLMPNFCLKDGVRKHLVAYLSTLMGQDYLEGTPPWNKPELMDDRIKRGQAIFQGMGCMGCHGGQGQGGYPNNNVAGGLIPSLTTVADGFSKEELEDKIRKGSTPVPENASEPPPMISMPPWGPILKEDELHDLVDYLFSLRPERSGEDDWN